LEVGSKVEIRDEDYVWSVGTVKLIIESSKRVPIFVVHYDRKSDSLNDEVIFRNSGRLEKFREYTNWNDIPRYIDICLVNKIVKALPGKNKAVAKVAESEQD
jgi:hypothetical protein